jgi:hypothetical protein
MGFCWYGDLFRKGVFRGKRSFPQTRMWFNGLDLDLDSYIRLVCKGVIFVYGLFYIFSDRFI